jgi:hypothetical protein
MRPAEGSRGRQRGSALIEFALGLVVLAPILTGLAGLAITVLTNDAIAVAAREGAAYGSMQPLGFGPEDEAFVQRVRNVAVFRNPEGAGKPRVAGLAPENVEVVVHRERGIPQAVEVGVAGYRAAGGSVSIARGPRVTYPYRGRLVN